MKLSLFPFSKQILFFALIIFMFGCNQNDIPDYNYFKVGDMEFKIENCVFSNILKMTLQVYLIWAFILTS